MRAVEQARGLGATAGTKVNLLDVRSLRRRLSTRPNGVPLRACTLGNSIFAGINGISFSDAALNLGAGAVTWISSGGVAGNNSQQMYARIATAVPADAEVCFFGEGPNDVALGAGGVTSHRVYMELIIQWLLSRGMTPVIVMASPYNNHADQIGAMCAVEFALAQKYGIDCVDPWLDNVDLPSGWWTSGANSDPVHPTYNTAVSAANRLAGWIAGTIGNTQFSPRSGGLSQAGYCLTVGNNFMLTDTNADGIADNWTQQGITAGNATPSLTAAPTGYRGKFQRLTSNGIGASNPNLNISVAGANVGDDILISYAMEAGSLNGPANQTANLSVTNGPIAGNQGLAGLQLATPAQRMAYRFKKAAAGSIQFFMSVNTVGSGNYVGIGEFEIYNLTALLAR